MFYKELRPISIKHLNKIINVLLHKYHVNMSTVNILDLFCGIGTFGIHCLKKMQARYVIFVDIKQTNINKIISHLQHRGITEFKCIKSDCFKLSLYNMQFHIIMVDPPYKRMFVTKALKVLHKLQLYTHNTIIICRKYIHEQVTMPTSMYIDYEQQESTSTIIYVRIV